MKKKKIVYKTDPHTNLTYRVVKETCKACEGTGEIDDNGAKPCRSCHGLGFIEIEL